MTGGEIGLQARRGKHFAKKILRAVLVTRCYGRRIHWLREQRCRLKPTWAPQGATVPHRRNGDARADAPQGTAGHIDRDGGLIQQNGEAAAARVLFRDRRGTREIPEASRQSSRGARLTSGGAGDISRAVRNSRNRYEGVAPKPGSRPTSETTRRSRRIGRQRELASRALRSFGCGSGASWHARAARIAHHN